MNNYLRIRINIVPVRLYVLLTMCALSTVTTVAQQVELSAVPGMREPRATERTFVRPRRVSVSATPTLHPFSFEQASNTERTAFELINRERVAKGLAALVWNSDLYRLARQHSEDMGGRGYFDHETPEGLMPKDRARAAGLRGFRVIAENIAYNKGYENPGAYAVERWMKSSGHRANILYSSFQYSAIGSYVASDGSVYLTQVFISR